MKYLQKAKQLIASKSDRMTAADWRIVGLSLMEGREAHPSDKAFSKWLKEEELSVSSNQQAEALWLANDQHWEFYKGKLGWHVRDARKAWNHLHVQLRSETRQLVLNTLLPKEQSNQQIAESAGLDLHRASQALRDLKKDGKAASDTRGHYRLPKASEQKPVATKSAKSGDLINSLKGFVNVALRFHEWLVASGESAAHLKSMSPKAAWEGGVYHMQTRPLASTWKDGVENTKDAPDGCIGWAKGIRYRMTAEPVWVPVTERGETKEALAKKRAVK